MVRDDYIYPGTNVLRNKQGITDQKELRDFERGVTAVRIAELRERPIRGDYGLPHLQAIHQHIFRDVYDWAGSVRTIDIAKGPAGDRTIFAFREDIPVQAGMIKSAIADAGYLRGLNREQHATNMAQIYARLNDLHPFREGNGRATRELMSQLAKESGRSLDFDRVNKPDWDRAAKLASRGDIDPVREVFLRITDVDRARAFDQLDAAPRALLAKFPELDGAVKSLQAAQVSGMDVQSARAQISTDLHEGRIISGNVSVRESRLVIGNAADYRGLIVRTPAEVGGTSSGEIVAISSRHALLKVGEMVGMVYERSSLDKDVQIGQRATIRNGVDQSVVLDKQDKSIEKGRDAMRIEYERGLAR